MLTTLFLVDVAVVVVVVVVAAVFNIVVVAVVIAGIEDVVEFEQTAPPMSHVLNKYFD